MNVTKTFTKGYANKTPIWAPKKQSQTSKRQKPMQSSLLQRIMKNTPISGTGRFSDYNPVTLSLLLSEKSTIVTTPIRTNKIYKIGFQVHMLNPQDCKPTGTVLTLRTDQVGGADIVPYPLLDEGVQEAPPIGCGRSGSPGELNFWGQQPNIKIISDIFRHYRPHPGLSHNFCRPPSRAYCTPIERPITFGMVITIVRVEGP
jgi:hypothetical protein